MAILNFSGKLTLLRAHDVGTKFGPPGDEIDGEVVFKLNTAPDNAFGFTLRNDPGLPAHQGMLDLLRSAFDRNWTVSTDVDIATGDKNGRSIRVALTL